MKKKQLVIILILLLSISVSVFSQSKVNYNYDSNYEFITKVLKKLQVPEVKIKKIIQIYRQINKRILPIKLEIQKSQIEFQQEYIKDKPNIDKLKKMIYEIGKLEAQIKVIQLEGEFSIRKILGDDLFFQFKGILEKLKKQAIKKKYTIKNK